jgi:hypothetical protein
MCRQNKRADRFQAHLSQMRKSKLRVRSHDLALSRFESREQAVMRIRFGLCVRKGRRHVSKFYMSDLVSTSTLPDSRTGKSSKEIFPVLAKHCYLAWVYDQSSAANLFFQKPLNFFCFPTSEISSTSVGVNLKSATFWYTFNRSSLPLVVKATIP